MYNRDNFKEDTYETQEEKTAEERSSGGKSAKGEKQNHQSQKRIQKGKKPSVIDSIKNDFTKDQKEEIPEKWTGQTSVLDVISLIRR